ncbi:PREDICTED: mitochondrial amidoxime reducing component 2 [Tarenaya hassleriana]|uniref:mitochondrial amidoxime reducing component 2 n=1 Tax=Tarenaya hassleriana TaxID=28532 RepID=UPI00053C9AF8|nr:PREDICTED: mitochondrial amidoxime reducing component 2 [Tarenaya hassleriana]
MEQSPKIASLFIYPIKSCRGISVPQAPVTPTGFRWDRHWLVVNYKGRAYTQRIVPQLALIKPEMPQEAFSEDWEPTNKSFMVIRAPGMNELKIPLTTPDSVAEGVSMWEWSGSALDEGEEAAKWFSDYIGKPSRLVRFKKDSEHRPVDPQYAAGYSTTFMDLFPFLFLSQGSLNELNMLLPEPVPVNRFRPNIFLDGCEPFGEDLWDEIKINDLVFKGVRLCSRCKVPTVDQETAVMGSEPTETLLKFRSDKVLMPDKKPRGKVFFGKEMVWDWKEGSSDGKGKLIKVGDPVLVAKKMTSRNEAAI